jgi:hypothetical protein
MQCSCIKVKCGTGVGKVQGWRTEHLCPLCDARAEDNKIKMEKIKLEEDANLLIAKRSRDIAKDQLLSEGVIEVKDGKTKVKKETT